MDGIRQSRISKFPVLVYTFSISSDQGRVMGEWGVLVQSLFLRKCHPSFHLVPNLNAC